MTTQYTSILKLALPVTGELSGTWGDVVNENITSMVEQAIAGLATINTWSANSHTLTSADGTTSESRCAMLVADDDGGGNPSAAATIICPAASKMYILRNISGQTVTLKTSGGTGIAVPNNTTALLFCDGTNVQHAVTSSTSLDLSAGLTMSGSASNIALGSNYISNGGTDAGLSFDGSNNATFSATITAPNLTLTNGGALRTSTTAGHTALIQAYDTDTGPGYITFGTLTAGTTPSFTLNNITAQGTWLASGTWTLPALTLGGAITGNSQNISGLGTLGCGAITSSGNSTMVSNGSYPHLFYDGLIQQATATSGRFISYGTYRNASAAAGEGFSIGYFNGSNWEEPFYFSRTALTTNAAVTSLAFQAGNPSLNIGTGALTAGAASFSSETNSGNLTFTGTGSLIQAPSNPMTFTVGGSERMRIDQTTGHVNASQVIRAQGSSSPTSGAGLELSYGGTADTADVLAYDRTAAAFKKLSLRGSQLTYGDGTGVRLTLDASGNLGVGISPTNAAKFYVSGYYASGGQNYSTRLSDGVNSTLWVGHQSGIANLIADTSIGFYASSIEKMVLSSTGLSVTGTLSSTSTANTKVLTVAAASSGDQFYIKPQAAASGIEVFSRNSADNAYAPLSILADTVTLRGAAVYGTFSSTGLSVTGALSAKLGFSGATTVLTVGNTANNSGATQLDFVANNTSVTARIAADYDQPTGNVPIKFSTMSGGVLGEKMTLDASGNLGLGVTPTTKLDVQVPGSGGPRVRFGGVGDNPYIEMLRWIGVGSDYYGNRIRQVGNTFSFDIAPSAALNAHSYTTAMTLDASGNLGVGISPTTSYRAYIKGAGSGAVSGLFVHNINSANYVADLYNEATSGDNKFVGFYTEGTATLRGSIDYNRAGGAVRYNTSSDATLKNIIGDAPQQKSIDILTNTRLREYSWKDDETNKPQIGVIAQEVYEVFKGAVSVGGEYEETDEEGNTVTKYRPWAVDKTAWTFHLVAGFQHLKQENEQLKAQLVALAARLDAAGL